MNDDEKNDLIKEYNQLKNTYEDLHTKLIKWTAGTLKDIPNYSKRLLELQEHHARLSLNQLRIKAEIYGIKLEY